MISKFCCYHGNNGVLLINTHLSINFAIAKLLILLTRFHTGFFCWEEGITIMVNERLQLYIIVAYISMPTHTNARIPFI